MRTRAQDVISCSAVVLLGLIAAESAAAVSFAPATTFPAGSRPLTVATADLDGDGHLDLAVTDFELFAVGVLMGDGLGSFGPMTIVAVGDLPLDVELADVDGDGAPDLAFTNAGSDLVSILLNDGSGSFGAPQHFAAGENARRLAVADLDSDGRPDLAVTNTAGSVSTLLGTGGGGFAAATDHAVGTFPEDVKAADVDGDLDIDLVVVNRGSSFPGTGGDVSVLLGDGAGSFAPEAVYPVGLFPLAAAVADFDGDGDADVAVANDASAAGDSVSLLAGNGDGTFADATDLDGGPRPRDVEAADFDCDGSLDLAVVNGQPAGVSISPGLGDGTFAPRAFFSSTGEVAASCALGDFDEDGRLDVAVANSVDPSIAVLVNTTACAPPVVVPDAADAYCLWPPNHSMACFDRDDFHPTVLGACGASSWVFVDCSSDPQDDATPDDCEVAPDGLSFCVRAERPGGGPAQPPRTYTVRILATSACGASTEADVGTVRVPHDQRAHPACAASR